MSNNIPIETPLGRFDGRDCIYLDHISFLDNETTLQLDGSINGDLCSIPKPGYICALFASVSWDACPPDDRVGFME